METWQHFLLITAGFGATGVMTLLSTIAVKWSPRRFKQRVHVGLALMIISAVTGFIATVELLISLS